MNLSNKLQPAAWLLLFVLVGMFVFHALWAPGAILMTTDDNIGHLIIYQRGMENSPIHNWQGEALWGMPGISLIRPAFFLLNLISADAFMNLFHGLCLALAAWLLALHLRNSGLRPAAAVFGGLVAFWVGTNLTLVYAGHIGKYGTLVFLSLAVYALERFGSTRRASWGIVAGAATGAMFLEQADVSLFCTLLLIPLGIREAWRAGGGTPAGILRKAWPAVLVALVLIVAASLSVHGSGVTDITDSQSADAHWDYITQWSQPPSESLDFIAPGWTGWRSGEPAGPYWGKMGRSAEWAATRQGFMNFKLENVYVGAIPLLFALLAIGESVRRRRDAPAGQTATVRLWAALCLLALLLSFGKFFPLYRVLSWLPGFSSIRNPNKFIHFFQLAWGVLAAYGLQAALDLPAARRRLWIIASASAGVLFLLSGTALWSDLSAGAAQLAAAGWPPAAARAIQWNKAFSLTYAGGAFLAGAALLWAIAFFHTMEKKSATFPHYGKKFSIAWKIRWWLWVPALVVLFDAAVILAPRYIQTMPKGYIAKTPLIDFLQTELRDNRAAFLQQDNYYNLWLTYLFPYHGIATINVTQLPRPPADYTAFWQAVTDPVRTWQLTGVSHVLVRGEVARQLLANPDWARALDIAWAYRPADDLQGGVAIHPVTPPTAAASEVVLALNPRPPRVAAVADWRVADDPTALRQLAARDFTPLATVLVAPEFHHALPTAPAETIGEAAAVSTTRVIPGRYEFTATNSQPVVIRIAEKYDPRWQASVNGQKQPVLRLDYMFQGIALDRPGTHDIVLRYAPSSAPVWMQAAGLLAGLAALLWLAVPRKRTAEEAAA